ncbi:SurA N-terminal domain-containing protein [Gilvimarinus sp. SDUM040013]|uniref:Periplasmic chaperone PpiD n=1 Tax=Gilvimarinus gilvus TaxID=3058038 RepID=A0ABU4RYL6_9GAMM|nr:SurA N-terminal domain-containing protein [Gilvimarinus sp. SDUM040013]MDO3385698.1 SurA N-terminal domain-containing protein [Gilvimarinus sp. SDUM040013]MDX6849336.1 SurA N-terminal domain-containing protein [Gilvimarinus sp. SDUM040013]
MLQSMRDNSKGLVAGILVGLLVIIFALSGAEALFNTRNQADVAAEVNGEEISETEVLRAIEQQRAQMRNRFGEAVPEDFLSDENLRSPALDQLIDRILLSQVAEEGDMTIAPERIASTIASIPAFQNAAGQFDPEQYRMSLARLAYTPANYKAELIRDMSVNQLVTGLRQSNFATATEVKYVAELNNQLRSFDYLTMDVNGLLDEVEPKEEQISEYYASNTDEFTVPEKVAVEYIELSVEKLQESQEVTEEALKRQYEQNIDSFTPSVERHVAHILLEEPTPEELTEVRAAIDGGDDFATIAAEYSDDLGSKDMGGDLGITTEGAFPDEFEEAIAAMAEGEVSGPVETDAGTHFIKLLSVSGGEPAPFSEQKDKIANQLKRAQAEARFVELLSSLEDLSYNAESLANVATELDLEVGRTDLFSREGGQGIAASGQVARAAFGEEVLEYGNASELIELTAERVVVVKKIDHQSSFVKELAEVRDDIVAKLKQEQAMALLAERGQSMVERIRGGTSFADLAAEFDLEANSANLVQRSNMDQPRGVVEFAFSLPVPSSDQPIVSGKGRSGEYMIVQLTEVDVPAGEMEQEQKASMQQALAGMFGASDFESYSRFLRETAEIE